MILQSQSNAIIRAFQEALKDKQKAVHAITYKIASLIVILASIAYGVLVYMADPLLFLIPYLSIIFTVIGIAFLIIKLYVPEKPTYETLYPKILDLYNQEGDSLLTHEAYPHKVYKDINKTSGLFTRGASVRVKQAISGRTEDNIAFTRLNTNFVVSSGNASSNVFSGVFIHLKQTLNSNFFVAYKGRPHLKGIKMTRIESPEPTKVYIEANGTYNKQVINQAINLIHKVSTEQGTPHVYLSSTPEGMFLAYKKPYEKYKTLTHDNIKILHSSIEKDLEYIETLNIKPDVYL